MRFTTQLRHANWPIRNVMRYFETIIIIYYVLIEGNKTKLGMRVLLVIKHHELLEYILYKRIHYVSLFRELILE